MKKFNIGVQLFSVRAELEADMDKTLCEIKEMGYDTVQFAEFFDKSAQDVKNLVDKYELRTHSIHLRLPDLLENEEKMIADMKLLGIKHYIEPMIAKDRFFGEWDNVVDMFKKSAELLKKHNMVLGYHNHAAEFLEIDGEKIFDKLIGEIGIGNMYPEFDVGWMESSGESPEEFMKKYAGNIPLLHLKDYIKTEEKLRFVPVGTGQLDVESVIRAAEKYGVEDIIVEQDGGCLADIRKSREYLKALGL